MKKITKEKGFSVVEVLIVVLVSAIVLALAIPSITRSRVNSNESYAKETLKQIGIAFEEYSRNNNGLYPLSIANLTTGTPRYLAKDYTAAPSQGYIFTCAYSMIDNSYACTAIPQRAWNTTTPTGTKNFYIAAGFKLTEDDAVSSAVGSSTGPINDTNVTNVTATVISGISN